MYTMLSARLLACLFAAALACCCWNAGPAAAAWRGPLISRAAPVQLDGPAPFGYCDGDGRHYPGTIESLTLQPFPALRGMPLSGTITGMLRDTVYPGAKMTATIKWGMVTLQTITFDLCAIAADVCAAFLCAYLAE
jgi:hypothetical protein